MFNVQKLKKIIRTFEIFLFSFLFFYKSVVENDSKKKIDKNNLLNF